MEDFKNLQETQLSSQPIRAVVDSIFARSLLAVRQADGILEDVQHVAVKDRLGRKLRFL